jgi:S1-C subfamily serine protease
MPSVSLIETASARGSAVPIRIQDGKTYFLTAKHVIAHLIDGIDDEAELETATVRGAPILKIWAHDDLDIALIVADVQLLGIGIFADEMPTYPQPLYAIGWHLGRDLLMTEGRAGGKLGSMSCPVIFGASGGAVLNKHAQLVGIIVTVGMAHTGGFSPHPIPHVAGYVPVDEFRDWYNEIMEEAR